MAFPRLTPTASIAISHYRYCVERRSLSVGAPGFPGCGFPSLHSYIARLFFSSPRTAVNVRDWQASAPGETLTSSFSSSPSCRFDTRLSSCTGSGHIRRPAALGLLLRYAPCGFRFLPKQIRPTRQGTPSQFLSVPSEKADLRHLGAGPTPAASPCVPRVNSGFKTEKQTCI